MSSKLRPFLHTLLVLALAVVATPRARAADEAPVRSATSLGAVGVHESVRSIMQRQAVLTAEGIVPGRRPERTAKVASGRRSRA